MHIVTVTVIGVTGTMGANIAGIFAAFGNAKVYCIGRDIEKVKKTIPRIVLSVKADSIARKLIEMADEDTKQEIEELIEGKTIEKPIHEDITYDEIYKSMDNLWNFMFFTGYFKKVKNDCKLKIKQIQ